MNKDILTRDEIRAITQEKFLEMFSLYGTISRACLEVGVHRSTIYEWLHTDTPFNLAFASAIEGYRDTIKNEIHARAVVGEQIPMVSRGTLVLDKNGDPVFITRKSDQLLGLLARAFVKEYRSVPGDSMNDMVQITRHSIVIHDIRKLSPEILDMLLQDLERIQDTEVHTIEADMSREADMQDA